MRYTAGVLVLAAVSPAVVSGAPSSVDENGVVAFSQIDSDNNGYVSRVEARSVKVVETRFDSADTNKDGLLDRREYTAVRPAREAD